jgi:hypothetical protein
MVRRSSSPAHGGQVPVPIDAEGRIKLRTSTVLWLAGALATILASVGAGAFARGSEHEETTKRIEALESSVRDGVAQRVEMGKVLQDFRQTMTESQARGQEQLKAVRQLAQDAKEERAEISKTLVEIRERISGLEAKVEARPRPGGK